jgi:hypothetical protein
MMWFKHASKLLLRWAQNLIEHRPRHRRLSISQSSRNVSFRLVQAASSSLRVFNTQYDSVGLIMRCAVWISSDARVGPPPVQQTELEKVSCQVR